MAERPSHDRRHHAVPPEPDSPDVVEQRQRLDGTVDDVDAPSIDPDVPLTPDMLEQRQRLDGGVDPESVYEPSSEPLTPDMIEQRRVVEDDDADEHRADGE